MNEYKYENCKNMLLKSKELSDLADQYLENEDFLINTYNAR